MMLLLRRVANPHQPVLNCEFGKFLAQIRLRQRSVKQRARRKQGRRKWGLELQPETSRWQPGIKRVVVPVAVAAAMLSDN
jgi:hypothetical protein